MKAFPFVLVTATSAVLSALPPAADAAESVLKFSDPTKPGQVVLRLGFGDVVITGTDGDEVIVTGDEAAEPSEEVNEDGFRRLDGEGGYLLEENNNVITVSLPGGPFGNGDDREMHMTVPRSTKVVLERAGPGDITVTGLTGDLEARGVIGDVELSDISGGVLVESVNGDIVARFAALPENRPVSISVVRGDVDLQVPLESRANVRFRTLRGEMITNFGKDRLQTRFESAMAGPASHARGEAAAPVNAGVDRALAGVDRARAEADWARAEMDRARAEAEAAAERSNSENQRGARNQPEKAVPPAVGVPPSPPMPPIPSVPPISGGKLVVGTLNGGGTDLIVSSITGDITLRKGE